MRHRIWTAVVAAAVAMARPAAAATDGAAVARLIDAMYPQLSTLYQDLHAHPELGFAETRTAAALAAEMRALGYEVTEKVGGTGVVARLRNGAGPTVMIRTELDGLPMQEKSGLPYASVAKTTAKNGETFVAHSCGHDVHMACWIGTARTLAALKAQWHGTVLFVAQPAEELVQGAQAMLDDGLFTRFGTPDVAFALHAWPLAYGTIGYTTGAVTSNAEWLDITFKGRGGHGSAPDKTIDPILIAARFIVDVQSVVSREKDPMEFGVVTVGAVQAGSVGNIIPDTAVLRGTIRSYKPEVRAKLLDGVRRTAEAAAAMAGAPAPEVRLTKAADAVVNSERVVAVTEPALEAALGAEHVTRLPPITASEDFSVFVDAGVPSMYFFLGVYPPERVAAARQAGGEPLAFNHSPAFAPVPDPSIKTGVRAMSAAVLNALATQWPRTAR